MIDRFRQTIKKYKLIEENDTIIVGSSGGPDSQFLTYLLNEIKDELKINIILAHLNHLHRKEAYIDEKLVKDTASRLNLGFRVKRASMDDYAKKSKISAEDAGRRLRYGFFNEIASEFPNAKIAIAHNKNDQAETMLIRMIRGTGLDGLLAMDYKSGNIIRPILSTSKEEILNYLDEHNIFYAYDKTNKENDYTRNYIRNEIIPKMETINPRTIDSFFNLSLLLRDDLEIIDKIVDNTYEKIVKEARDNLIYFDKNDFETLDYPLKTRVLRKAILNLKGDLKDFSKENIDYFINVINLENGKKIIKDDIVLKKNYNTYDLYIKQNKKKALFKDYSKLYLNKDLKFNSLTIRASLTNERLQKNKNIGYFDYDKLSFPLEIRYRKNGDKFKPYGMDHTKKLKDFFIDEKIDRNERDRIPIVVSDSNIIWLVGHRISNDYKVSKSSKKILKIEVEND